jgi:sortase (surface protein transpeptidase)
VITTAARTARLIAALLVALALGGCAQVTAAGDRAHAALVRHFDDHARDRSPVAGEIPASVRDFRARSEAEVAPRPARIEIPSIDVTSDLDPLDLAGDGAIEPPPRWETAGWYRRGVRPGQRGPAVILGHVDSATGPAVFFRLDELDKGDEIHIVREDGSTARFAVQRSQRYRKARFPTGEVYLPTPDPTLRLVTCTGEFDRAAGSYRDNLVVFADLIR